MVEFSHAMLLPCLEPNCNKTGGQLLLHQFEYVTKANITEKDKFAFD